MGSSEYDDKDGGGHGEFEDFGLSVVVVSLAFGVFARTVFGKRLTTGYKLKTLLDLTRVLPYTVWLLLFGVLLGCINLENQDNVMNSSIEAWQNVEAHVLLYVFLPALLFESSFSTDVHIM